MKHTLLYIALSTAVSAAIVGAPAVFAQTPDHIPAQTIPGGQSTQSRQTTNPVASNDASMNRHSAKLDAAMEKVNAQLVKINETRDGREQRSLVEAHMDSMQENFETLQEVVNDTRVSVTTPAAPAGRTMRSPSATGSASISASTSASGVTPTASDHHGSGTPIDQQMVNLERQLKQTQHRLESDTGNASGQSNRQLGRDHLVSLQANVDTMQAIVDSVTQQHSSARMTSPADTPMTSSTQPPR
jgi:ribosome-associated translation inhibitor RaiA